MRKILNAALACLFTLPLFVAVGCSEDQNVSASIGIANGTDKILQSYQYEDNEDRFMGALQDTFSVTAFRNEYESRQIIITPETDVDDYYVSVSDFRCGQAVIPADSFDIRHEYYHEVSSIYDVNSEMETGMYPDALLPMQTARDYGLTEIEAGHNQGVYVTVHIADKQQPAGIYSGTLTVTLNGEIRYEIPGTVTVLDYTLPDTVSLASCIPTQISYIVDGEYDDTQEMYQKYLDALNEFRLAGQYLSSYIPGGTISAQEAAEYDAHLAVEAAGDVSVPSYAIRVFEAYSDEQGGKILNEETFQTYLRVCIDESISSGVDLFKKAYVYMGNIIDEPDVGGFYDRANFVCRQFDEQVEEALLYAKSKDASPEVQNSLINLRHVVTGAYSENLPDVDTYCPTADVIGTSATVEDYRALRENGKDYWWYTCTLPKIPYPTVHIDDNGVSSRVMSWMAKDYDIGGYLTWESAYYRTDDGSASQRIPAQDCYDNVHRWTDAYGDGFFFYPGSIYGISGPVPSMRLYMIRDGLEDYEALLDLENIYTSLGAEYGADISADGILGSLYSSLYRGNRVYCTSGEVEEAKRILGDLLVLAEDGVAISDFSVGSDGCAEAEVYAPADAEITFNGEALAFEGGCCKVSDNTGAFVLENGAEGVSVPYGKITVLDDFTDSVEKITVFGADLNPDENAKIEQSQQDGKDTVSVEMGEENHVLTYAFAESTVDAETDRLYLGVYLSGTTSRVEVTLYLQGEQNRLYALDTVYLSPGYNQIEIERLCDADWSRLYNAKYLRFGFSDSGAFTLDFAYLFKSE